MNKILVLWRLTMKRRTFIQQIGAGVAVMGAAPAFAQD
ncbi:MAG: hypothetical protein ACI9PU_002243, partial [Ascidiaceihabitans sp.]